MKYQLGRGQELDHCWNSNDRRQHAVDGLPRIVGGSTRRRYASTTSTALDVLSRAELAGLTSDVQLDVPPGLSPDVEVGCTSP